MVSKHTEMVATANVAPVTAAFIIPSKRVTTFFGVCVIIGHRDGWNRVMGGRPLLCLLGRPLKQIVTGENSVVTSPAG
jgi:hypothetical protein